MDPGKAKSQKEADQNLETINGGDVTDYAELEVKPKHHREVTTSRLAMTLVVMLDRKSVV